MIRPAQNVQPAPKRQDAHSKPNPSLQTRHRSPPATAMQTRRAFHPMAVGHRRAMRPMQPAAHDAVVATQGQPPDSGAAPRQQQDARLAQEQPLASQLVPRRRHDRGSMPDGRQPVPPWPANGAPVHCWAPQPAFQPLAPRLQAQAGTLDTLRAAPQPPAPGAPQTSSAQPVPLRAHSPPWPDVGMQPAHSPPATTLPACRHHPRAASRPRPIARAGTPACAAASS